MGRPAGRAPGERRRRLVGGLHRKTRPLLHTRGPQVGNVDGRGLRKGGTVTTKTTIGSSGTLEPPGAPTAKPAAAKEGTLAYVFLVFGSVGTIAMFAASLTTFIASVLAVLVASWVTRRRLVEAGGGVVIAVTGWLLRADLSGLPPGYLIVGLAATALSLVPLATWRRMPGRFPLLGIFLAVQGVYIYVGTLIAQPSLPFQATYPLHVREVGLVATLG